MIGGLPDRGLRVREEITLEQFLALTASQVSPMQIECDCHLEPGGLIKVPHDEEWDILQPHAGKVRRAESLVAVDDQQGVGSAFNRADVDRASDPVLFDRLNQRVELGRR